MQKWEELTKQFNETRDKQKERELLKQLFGGDEFWVIAKIIKYPVIIKAKETNKTGITILPVFILNDQDRTACTYKLDNDVLTPGDLSIFKPLSSIEEMLIRNFNTSSYFKLKVSLLDTNHVNPTKTRENRLSFVIDETMHCVGDYIELKSFLNQKYELNGDNIIYKLLNQQGNIEDRAFIVALSDNLREKVENKANDYSKRLGRKIKQVFEKRKKDFNDTYKEEIESKKKELDDELTSYQQNTEASIERIKSNKESYLKEIADLYNQKRDLKTKIEGLEKLCEQLEKKKRIYENFFVNSAAETKISKKEVKHSLKEFTAFNEMIDYAQKYLINDKEKLSYSQDILKSFYLGLQTEQLILLMGKPGTGKTSLARKFAELFGFEDTAIIPVQSNWSDKGDLLGYYNPIEKNYITTPFLDCLLKFNAEAYKPENKDKLYLICLDEMNLAHIEYYFAEFLSVLQGDRTLRLYSKKIKEDIERRLMLSGFFEDSKVLSREEIAEKMNSSNMSVLERKYFLNLCGMAEMIVNIPAEIVIHPHIKFIGTLNQDATTLDISPKVLDRSYIVRINSRNSEKIELNNEKSYNDKILYKPIEMYSEHYDYNDNEKKLKEDIISSVNEIVYYSQRNQKQTFDNENFIKWCKVMGTGKTIEFLLTATFMPKIRLYCEETAFDTKKNELDNISKEIKEYHKKLENSELDKTMIEEVLEEIMSKDGIDFWRS